MSDSTAMTPRCLDSDRISANLPVLSRRSAFFAQLMSLVVVALLAATPALALRCTKGTRAKRVRAGRDRMRVCVRRRGGQRHGPFVRYDRSGRKREAGAYRDGVRDGAYRIWHRRGAVIEKGTYVLGKRSGERKRWYRSGKPRLVETWRGGERDGPYEVWFRNSSTRGAYAHGHKQGVWVTTLYAGGRKQTTWVDGHRQGIYEAFGRKGQRVALGRFEGDRRAGPWQGWWPDASPRFTESYVDGKRQGVEKRWHPNGGPLAAETVWLAGKREGTARRWSAAGKLLLEGRWHAGRRHGVFHSYFADGSLASSSRWIEDRLSGRQDRFWPGHGRLMVTAHWRHGALDGPWARYRKDGSVALEGTFRAGERIGAWRRPLRRPPPNPAQKQTARPPTRGAGGQTRH